MVSNGVSIGVEGVVSLELSPPVNFILNQAGRFQELLTDFTGLWERFSELMGGFEEDRWQSQGFGDWPELAPSTLLEKEKAGYPADAMIRTGALRDSLVDPSQAASIDTVEMTWGTDVDYAQYHQDGTATLPQRKVLDLSLDQRRKLESAIIGWVNEQAAVAWREAA